MSRARKIKALETRNTHTVGIWGAGGIRHLLRGNYIMPLPLTRYTFWIRRGEWRIFHVSNFNLVD